MWRRDRVPRGGLYARFSLNASEVALWYKTLRPYLLQAVSTAIEAAYTADPHRLPALNTLIERIKAQAPAPVPRPPWWTPEIAAAVQARGINGAFEVLRALHQDSDWRACHLAMKDEELTRPGREPAYLARCRQYAAQYPADRADWLAEIARVETRLQAEGSPGPRPPPPPQIGSFTHVSARGPQARRLPRLVGRGLPRTAIRGRTPEDLDAHD